MNKLGNYLKKINKLEALWIFIAVIFTSLVVSFVSLGIKDNDTAIKISTMSIYKDMDYSFLSEYEYGNNHKNEAVLTFNTVKDLSESEDIRLKNGKYVTTLGYYEKNDLGGANYLISSTSFVGSIPLKNGLYANLIGDIHESNNTKWLILSIKQFGAKGDGINSDQSAITNAFAYAESFKEKDRAIIYMPEGEYKATNQIQANASNINLVWEGDKSIIFTDNDYRADSAYDEPFFASWNGSDNFFGFFRIEAREVDIYKYMRQMCLYYNENVYIYQINYYIPESAWSGKYYEDKQYTNLTIYAGNKIVTVDNCEMYQMSGTYRGANIGIMDFWKTGTEDITIMNSKLYDNARDEQIGIFSISGDSNSYIKGVDFVNNEVYSYKTPYSNIHGWRTMCFTVAYNDNNVTDINIRDNTFISEADSKFMTFGSVKDCKVENNKFIIKSSNGNMGYVFDSSATYNEDVVINNNEFYLTYKTTPKEGKCLSAGNLTFSNNRVVSDSTITKLSDRLGIYENNEFISLTPFGSAGSAIKFNNNSVVNYGGHINQYSEMMFILNEGDENTNIEFIGNTFDDYTYYHGPKNQKVYDRLSSINRVTLNSLNFSNNTYNAPNYGYQSNDYIYASWYRSANIKNITYQNNDFQGVKGFFGIDTPSGNNKTREFNKNINDDLITSMSILYNNKVTEEITTTSSEVKLDYLAKIDEKEINTANVDWISAFPSIATVENGTIKRQSYGDVKIFVAAKDGSGVYSEVTIHFIKSKAKKIEVQEEKISIPIGNQHKVIAKVYPYEESSQKLTYESSNEDIISVTASGDIIANKIGSAYILCKTTDGSNLTKRIDVTVTNLTVTKIVLNETYGYFENIGITKQLEVTEYLPANAINKGIGKWMSTSPEVATVDKNGKVSIVGYGKTTIRVYTSDMSRYATYNIYVKPDKVNGIEISPYKTRNQITWEPKDNVEGYNIYRKETSSDKWEKIASQLKETVTEYYDTNLKSNTSYDYYITAVVFGYDTNTKLEYEGVSSDIITSKTTKKEPIKSLTANIETLSIPINSIEKLYISYAPKNAEVDYFDWQIADSSIISTYKVEADNSVFYKGDKLGFTSITITPNDESNIKLTVPVGVVPTYQVKDVNLSSNYNNITVKWKPIDEENAIAGYIIYRSSTVEYREIKTLSLNELKLENGYYTYEDSNLSFNTNYRYTIRPYIEHDNHKFPCLSSKDVSIKIPEYVPVTEITTEKEYILSIGEQKKITASSANQSSINDFLWALNTNDSKISILENNKTSAIIKANKSGISYLDIIALDEDCYYTTAKVIVLPSKILNVASNNVTPKEINFSWNKEDGVSGYNIYRYEDNKWMLLSSTSKTTYQDINLISDKEYLYKVASYIESDGKIYEGEASSTLKVKTLKETISITPPTTKSTTSTTTRPTTMKTTTTKKTTTTTKKALEVINTTKIVTTNQKNSTTTTANSFKNTSKQTTLNTNKIETPTSNSTSTTNQYAVSNNEEKNNEQKNIKYLIWLLVFIIAIIIYIIYKKMTSKKEE